ncbi:hypothetical protein AB0B71_27020 [Micromonospora echinofusca]|uniref:hypothetical protein n=1 Tax=Micromonospora echinofusca TaxID=47858 RepID=UPI00340C88F2
MAKKKEPGRMIEISRTDGGWTMTARWEVEGGQVTTANPAEVTIRPSSDAPVATRARGVSTSVMRRFEPLLAEMTAEATGTVSPFVRPSDVARKVAAEAVQGMPASPRVDPAAYYNGLLDAADKLDAIGTPNPVQVLGEVLNVNPFTVKTQLATARRRFPRG